MTPRNLELLKWVGLVGMLADHVWLYAFAAPNAYSEALGAIALPLFALAIAEGVKNQSFESRTRTLQRLVLGACAAQLAVLIVREFMPLNVIYTIGAGVLADSALRYAPLRKYRAPALGAAVAVGFVAEFEFIGVGLVWALCHYARTRSDTALAVALAMLVALFPYNGNHWALATVPVAVAVFLLPPEMPRVRGGFYWIYCLQWPLIGLLQAFRTG